MIHSTAAHKIEQTNNQSNTAVWTTSVDQLYESAIILCALKVISKNDILHKKIKHLLFAFYCLVCVCILYCSWYHIYSIEQNSAVCYLWVFYIWDFSLQMTKATCWTQWEQWRRTPMWTALPGSSFASPTFGSTLSTTRRMTRYWTLSIYIWVHGRISVITFSSYTCRRLITAVSIYQRLKD